MNKIKTLTYILFLLSSGCASSTYYIELSPRYEQLSEKFFDNYDSKNVYAYDVQKSDVQGFGGQISIIEDTKFLFARISYFKSEMKSDAFTYSTAITPTATEAVKISGNGFETSIGLHLWHLRPYVSSNYTSYTFLQPVSLEHPEYNNLVNIGFGLAFDIPITESTRLFVNNHFVNGSSSHSIGVIFGGWKTSVGNDKKTPKRKR